MLSHEMTACERLRNILVAVAVLGFCVWGAKGAGIFVWGAKGGLSAYNRKIGKCHLQLLKARGSSRRGGLGERRKLPQWGLGRSPRNRRDFEHFKPKWSTF